MRNGLIALIAAVLVFQVLYLAWLYQDDLRTARELLAIESAATSEAAESMPLTLHGGPISPSDDPGLGQERLTGSVLFADGTPALTAEIIADQRTLAADQITASHHRRPRWRTAPDGDGAFSFNTLEPGDYVILARTADHHAFAQIALGPQAAVPNVDLILHPSRTHRGRVLDPANEPVARADVYALPGEQFAEDASRFASAWHPVRSDISGYFFLAQLPETPVRLLVIHPDFANHLTEPIGDVEEIVLDLGVEATVQLADDGAPVSRAKVRLREASLGIESVSSHSDRAGRAVFNHLRPATYEVWLESDRHALAEGQAEFTVTAPGPNLISLEALRGGTIRGRVVEEATGVGMPGIRVSVTSDVPNPELAVQTDRGGYYRLAGLTPGQYTVRADPGEAHLVSGDAAGEVEVRSNDRSNGPEFQLRPGVPVRGVVKTGDDAVASGANVFLSIDGSETAHRALRADDYGAFSFDGIPADATVRIWAVLGDWASRHFGPAAPGETGLPNIALVLDHSRTALIRGEVVDGTGAAAARATVELTLPREGGIAPQRTETDAWGTYQFDKLPPGDYVVRVAAEAAGLADAPSRPVRLEDGATETVNLSLD